uniref:Major capsid protein n=1 Tax=Dulem virus 248 TaxID=3145725 RepID=A0AAU8BC11_9VIRU
MSTMFKKQRHVAKLPKNVHDLSFHRSFTSGIGHILPVLYDFLSPGEKVILNDHIQTQAQPMVSNSQMRITEHLEYFFVPMEQLLSSFGSFYYGIMDVNSSFYKDAKKGLVPPSISLSEYGKALISATFDTSATSADVRLDMMGLNRIDGFARLVDLMDYGHDVLNTSAYTGSAPSYTYVCPWFFAAYQKIWNDVYRLDDWISPNPSSYNFDQYLNVIPAVIPEVPDGLLDMFTIRYRPWKKDYFTNIFPNPYFVSASYEDGTSYGNESSFSSFARLVDYAGGDMTVYGPKSSNVMVDTPTGVSNSSDYNQSFHAMPNSLVSGQGPNSGIPYNNNGMLSVADLSLLYAKDKLSKITNNTAKHYDKQTKAHFGFDVPQGISGEVYRLGSHDSYLGVGVVYATATTDTGSSDGSFLGEQGGRINGSSGNNKAISFTAPCHGILMCLYSAECESDYLALGQSPLHSFINSDDFYKPEFDSLGMTYLNSREFFTPDNGATSASSPFGWTYRYAALKTRVDKVNGALAYTLRSWMPSRTAFSLNDYKGVKSLYISPEYTNPCFIAQFGTGSSISPSDPFPWSDIFERDPLLHFVDFTYKKISPMSTYGVPNL